MKRWNPDLYPSGGWLMVLEDGTPLRGRNREDLEIQLVEYLVRTNQSTENVSDRIDEYFCRRQPAKCRQELRRPTPSFGVVLAAKLHAYVAKTFRVHNLKSGGVPRVDPEVAAERAAICRSCPHNREWTVTCSMCEESLRVLSKKLLAPGPQVDDSGLRGCGVFGVWLPMFIRTRWEKFEDRAPDHCWRKAPAK